ncbi:MAG: ribosome recycling factor [Candidatus Kerfeldbacteria bacterium]|nr:ribosome recycling factor [Candidatus Kerfeldbacteria bacterium]
MTTSPAADSFTPILEHFRHELASIRTDRATSALVEGIRVDAYGSMMPLVQLATITIPEPRVIHIQPWDKSTLKAVEKAILQSDLGITPTVDSTAVRVILPQLTEERRTQIVKLVRERLEHARIAGRSAREDLLKAIRADQKSGTLSEDAAFAQEKALQKQVEDLNRSLDELAEKKEADIRTV